MFGSNFRAGDGKQLRLWRWEAAEPKGTLLIVHGTAEHARRYDEMAIALMKRGYSVYALDLRGHGQTAAAHERGDFGRGGYRRVLQDLREVRKTIPGPCVLFGHSLGAILAGLLAQSDGRDFCGVILSGVALGHAFLRAVAPAVARICGFISGEHRPNGFLDQMTFGPFNKPFDPAPTRFEWLSTLRTQVTAYVKDPDCGFVCTADFFYQLACMLRLFLKPARMAMIPRTLPVEIFSGLQDPAGAYGAHARDLHQRMGAAGLSCGLTLYPDCRHEILHDVYAQEMTETIGDMMDEWCASDIKKEQ